MSDECDDCKGAGYFVTSVSPEKTTEKCEACDGTGECLIESYICSYCLAGNHQYHESSIYRLGCQYANCCCDVMPNK